MARNTISSLAVAAFCASGIASAERTAALTDAYPTSPSFVASSAGDAMLGIGFGIPVRCERGGLELASPITGSVETLRFLAARGAVPRGDGVLPGSVNLLVGRDPASWLRDARRFGAVVYPNLWPRIDLRVYGTANGVEFDAIVHPGGRPQAIAFESDAPDFVRDSGGTVSWSSAGLVLRAPVVYQESPDGRRRPVAGEFRLARGGRLTFAVGRYDRQRDLTIDPELAWSRYLGGDGAASGTPFDSAFGDAAYNVTRDGDGNTYVVGYTGSANFPLVNPISTVALGNEDAFIAKFDPNGVPLFISVIGGSKIDRFTGVALGPDGSMYLAGYTQSVDLPTTAGVFAKDYPNDPQSFNLSGFAVKLPASGDSIAWCTYVGGGYSDVTYRVAVDKNGDPFFAGYTYQSTYGGKLRRFGSPGGLDGLVLELDASASGILYVDAIGGAGQDLFNDLKLDALGRAYVGGYTNSPDFPATAGAYQRTCSCNPASAPNDQSGTFVRVSAAGDQLEYASYLANSETRVGALVPDGLGGMWATGATTDPTFATFGNPAQASFGAGTLAAFLVHVAPDGKSLTYATFLASGTPDPSVLAIVGGRGIAANPSASLIFVCGAIGPGPGSLPAVDPLPGGDHYAGGLSDGFVAAFHGDGTLIFSSYLGGDGEDLMYKMAADGCGNVSVVGQTSSADFPTAGSVETHYAGRNGYPNATVSILRFNDGDCDRMVVPVPGSAAGSVNPRP